MAGYPILEIADKLWTGEVDPHDAHPWFPESQLVEISDDVAFIPSFANVTAVSTEDGLVLVDTGSAMLARQVHGFLRSWTKDRLNSAVYSHGHIDHVFGVPVWEEESAEKGWPEPVVYAHEAMPARFDRYIKTAGYNGIINQRQFQIPGFQWPTEYRYPDETYASHLELEIGGVKVVLNHAKGETDDHTYTWFPDQKLLCCGDLFIWASPNAGNPQKVQRYPLEWAQALRAMLKLGPEPPEVLLSGHGVPILGADRIKEALTNTALYLESLVDQTLVLMNEGARLSDIIHSVSPPSDLAGLPYLQPVYDEPEFIVRNIWRLYGGWWDGNPSNLKPAHEVALAKELSLLAGGARKLSDRALELVNEATKLAGVDLMSLGTTPMAANKEVPFEAQQCLRLAGHLVESASLAAPEDLEIHEARKAVFGAMAGAATSTMSKGVFMWSANQSGKILGDHTSHGGHHH